MLETQAARNVLVIFGCGGILASVGTLVLKSAMLNSSSPAMFLFANPSFIFASSMLLIGSLAVNRRIIPGSLTFSGLRVTSGFILCAATYPVGLLLGLLVSSLIPESMPYLPEIGLTMSLGFIAIVPAVALRLIYLRWPPEFWKGILVFGLSVPTLTAIIGSLFFRSYSHSLDSGVSLTVADMTLSLLLGHWFYTIAHSSASKSS